MRMRALIFAGIVLAFAAASAPAAMPYSAPLVLYTDIASGPNTGGENGHGAYLSIFGKNFGNSGLGSVVKVTIGGVAVDNYRYLGPSKGRTDVEQISVQVGALGNPTPGTALPIQVTVGATGSNTDQTFTVNPGRLLFVDNVHGVDATAVPGDVTRPYRHVQVADTSNAAYGAMQPGDIIVLRGTGTPWTDLGNDTYFVKFIGKNASAPTGAAGTGPFTLMGYPGEDVFIEIAGNVTHKGAISGIDTTGGFAGGLWITLADLRIESGGNSGVVAVQIAGDHWRIVNNELTAATATNSALAGGINGNATNAYWVGNHIHNIAGGAAQENHGVYIDGDGSYEIAYNHIDHVSGGNGMQIYVNGGNGSDVANNVHFHHNLVHDISKHGINIADNAQNNIQAWNNIVYNTAFAGLRLNTAILHGARIYNNTFYNAVSSGSTPLYGVITNDSSLPSDALDLRNNLFLPIPGAYYAGGSVGFAGSLGTISNNLWFGGIGSIGFDTHALTADPSFVNAGAADFHLNPASPAIDQGVAAVSAVVGDDFDAVVPRPVAAGFDIGAQEYAAGYAYDRIFANAFE
jgi:hypothetical protein